MEKSKKTEILVRHLHSSYILCKEHDDESCREFLIYEPKYNSYEVKGWGSALGNTNDRLVELITNPDNWKVVDFNMGLRDYPYPWSSKETEYKFISFLNW